MENIYVCCERLFFNDVSKIYFRISRIKPNTNLMDMYVNCGRRAGDWMLGMTQASKMHNLRHSSKTLLTLQTSNLLEYHCKSAQYHF
jgi:hypothetical protein